MSLFGVFITAHLFLLEPRSCLDVKVYRNVNEDGYFTIYPIPAGLLPMRVFCVGMATDTPSQFVDVVHGGEGKNYALASPDKAVTGTCDYDSSISYASAGLTRFSKVCCFISLFLFFLPSEP